MHAPPVAAAAAQPSFHRGAANSQMSMASMRSTLLEYAGRLPRACVRYCYPSLEQQRPSHPSDRLLSLLSSPHSVVTGGGELEPEVQPQRKVDTMCPYLLIDLRDKDDFAKCHIRGGAAASGGKGGGGGGGGGEECSFFVEDDGRVPLALGDSKRVHL